MILTDQTLRDLIAALTEPARQVLYAHVLLGVTSDESWSALRWIKRRLKREARGKR